MRFRKISFFPLASLASLAVNPSQIIIRTQNWSLMYMPSNAIEVKVHDAAGTIVLNLP